MSASLYAGLRPQATGKRGMNRTRKEGIASAIAFVLFLIILAATIIQSRLHRDANA